MDTRLASGKETRLLSRRSVLMTERGSTTGVIRKVSKRGSKSVTDESMPTRWRFTLTLYDPTYYTAPWVSDTKVFRREPPSNHTFYGWYGLFSGITEEICAPLNEVDDFNRRIRDPAGVGR